MFFFYSFIACSSINRSAHMAPLHVNVTANQEANIKVIGKTTGSSETLTCLGFLKFNNDNKFVDNPTFSPQIHYGGFFANSLSNGKSAASYRALERKNADILLAPMYKIHQETGLFCTKTEIQVTGFAAKLLGFKNEHVTLPNSTIHDQTTEETPVEVAPEVEPIIEKPRIIKKPPKLKKEKQASKKTPSPPKEESISVEKQTSKPVSKNNKNLSILIEQSTGKLGEQEIISAIWKRSGNIIQCVNQYQKQKSIDVSYFLLVNGKGKVSTYNVLEDNSNNKDLIQCLTRNIQYVAFPSVSGISNVRIQFTLKKDS